jgi:hypothetical protein
MATVPMTAPPALARRTSPFAAWTLAVGGVLFLIGGALHPTEDLPGASMAQQLRAMYQEPIWYPAHGTMFVGMVLVTVALFALVRDARVAGVARVRTMTRIAAVTSALATVGALIHVVAATDTDRIGQSDTLPPLSALHLILDTVSVPLFSFSIAALAIVGALTRTLGNWVIAVPGVVGGIGYGLAGGTAAYTPVFDPLFPTALGVALWLTAAGVALLVRRRTA